MTFENIHGKVVAMGGYNGKNGDTLRSIARQFHIRVEDLLLHNPSIVNPDQNVGGLQVMMPPADESFGIPACPPTFYQNASKHWIPLTPLEEMAETEYDVLIVGSGAGGGAVLWRLCEEWGENGKKIGLIESGDLVLPTHAFNVPTLNYITARQMMQNFYIPIGEELPEFPGAVEKLFFGGGTLIWGTVSPRMKHSEIRKWPISLSEMDYYYKAAEWIMNVNRNFGRGSSLTEGVLGRLHRNGFTEADIRPMALDLEQTKYGMLHSNVFFSSINFFAYALNRRPVDVAVKARAVKVLTDEGKVIGVEAVQPNKQSFVLKAKKVVLSAGTFGTTRILLHSGIKGTAIGHYLTDHAGIAATGIMSREGFSEVLGTLNVLVPESDDKPYQVEIQRIDKYYFYKYMREPLLKDLETLIFGSCKLESRFENYLALDPHNKDEYGVPKLKAHFSYSEKDKQAIRQTIEGVKHISTVVGVSLTPLGSIPSICLLSPGQERHSSGTCRIGKDPLTAAANPYGEIFGVTGLFVADNSMLPSMSAANPTLTTVALAIRTADQIVRQFQS